MNGWKYYWSELERDPCVPQLDLEFPLTSHNLGPSSTAVNIWKVQTLQYMLDVSPCHYSMGRPRVADGRDGLQQWKVAANILNKQPRTNDKGWSSSWRLGVGLTKPRPKTEAC
jgi:hypothetical protein